MDLWRRNLLQLLHCWASEAALAKKLLSIEQSSEMNLKELKQFSQDNTAEHKMKVDKLQERVAELEDLCRHRLVERKRTQLYLVLLMANPTLLTNRQQEKIWRWRLNMTSAQLRCCSSYLY